MHLQKALSKGALISMNYSDGLQNYSDYIRIPVNGEYNDSSIWNLTYNTINSGISYVKVNNSSVSTHDNFLKIKPIIKVYKESETLKRISRLETEVQIREAQITSLQADIEINKGNTAVVSSLQSQINTLNSEIDNLNIQIEELRVSLPAS
jgi:peptidoglycan hydrolase CwlO-like protein